MALYLLITIRTDNFNPDDIKGHYDHIERLRIEGRLDMFGPFSDSTGGAYLIKASSLDEANRIGHSDPLIQNGSSTLMVKEWLLR